MNEEGRLIFANAHYFIASDEWKFWISESAPAKAGAALANIARTNLQPLQDRLTLVDDAFEIVPGIRVVASIVLLNLSANLCVFSV